MTLIDKAEALAEIKKLWTVGSVIGGDLTLKKIEAVLNALPARGVWVTWHPFDTAPRDGSRFLAQGGGLDAIDICSYNARVGCWDCGSVTLDDTDHEPEGYNRPAQWMPLAALAPTDAAHVNETQSDYRLAPHLQSIVEAAKTAPQWDTVNDRMAPQPAPDAHVNETPKSEHDAGNVLTAAQAREAALHIENAKRLRRYDWQEWTAQDIEDAEGIICAYLALIGEPRTWA